MKVKTSRNKIEITGEQLPTDYTEAEFVTQWARLIRAGEEVRRELAAHHPEAVELETNYQEKKAS